MRNRRGVNNDRKIHGSVESTDFGFQACSTKKQEHDDDGSNSILNLFSTIVRCEGLLGFSFI